MLLADVCRCFATVLAAVTAPEPLFKYMRLYRDSACQTVMTTSCLLYLCQLSLESLVVSFENDEGLEGHAVSCHLRELGREV